VEELHYYRDNLWEMFVGMDKRVSELVRGWEELEDRVAWVEQRGWSPDFWTVVGDKLVAGKEDGAEVDAME
jgi:hypothetical protein